MNTEIRQGWYIEAEKWEQDFIKKYGETYKLIINPSKSISKYAPDLFMLTNSMSADLKLLKEPFYKSKNIFNIEPQYCWTFNVSDYFSYSAEYPDSFGIFIWKIFEQSNKYGVNINKEESVYYTTLFDLKRIINKEGKIHKYIRRMNDNNGNSYGSYGIDLRRLFII